MLDVTEQLERYATHLGDHVDAVPTEEIFAGGTFPLIDGEPDHSSKRRQRVRRSILAIACALVVAAGSVAVLAQRGAPEGDDAVAQPTPSTPVDTEVGGDDPPTSNPSDTASSVFHTFADGTEVVVSTSRTTLGPLAVEVVDVPQDGEGEETGLPETMSFALRLENRGSAVVHFNDTRAAAFLDDESRIVIADDRCGYSPGDDDNPPSAGVCLAVFIGGSIEPGHTAELPMGITPIEPLGILEQEAVYTFERRVEISAAAFGPDRPAPDDVATYEVELTVQVVPPR